MQKNRPAAAPPPSGQADHPSLTITIPSYDHTLQYSIRREPSRLVLEPQFDYKDEEARYILSHLLSEKHLAKWEKQGLPIFPRTDSERQAAVAHFLKQIERYRPSAAVFRRKLPAPIPHWPDEVADIVVGALRIFGYDAIRLSLAEELVMRPKKKAIPQSGSIRLSLAEELIERQQDTRALAHGYLASLDRLGVVIGAIIRDWQKRVREEHDLQQRHRALKNLRQVGKALIPLTKGKRVHRVGAPRAEVQKHYYQELFRYEQARALLKQTVPSYRRWQPRFLGVCHVLNLPKDPQQWGFSEEEQVLRQLRRAQENAVLVTARHFNMTEQTIRNIVSG